MEQPLKIKKLDEAVVNKIAAGEVIQRPANALKELIENSLDAKSTNIQIVVKNGGLKLLQITDNGTGIRKEDFSIVCERFTTSKLREFEDLNTISTYGFRGEALASISHVAHLTIVSKTADEKCAFRAKYEDSKLIDTLKPTAGTQGTQITIEDLFYNMNIRKRALRSPAEEYQKITEVVEKYAIHNANVGFGLRKQGENNDVKTPCNSTKLDNIRLIYGHIIARELIEFSLENDPYKFKVQGYITNPNYSTKKFIFLLFINHRLVECQALKKCIDQVYTTYLPKNSHPFVYLSLELDPKNVDVNVHPTKHEVHFFNEEQIIELIMAAVETKLLGSNNSRVFYTQAKLPNVTKELTVSDTDKTRPVYDKDYVRTDSNEQKITKFFRAPDTINTSIEIVNDDVSMTEEEQQKPTEESMVRNDNFENMIVESNQMQTNDTENQNSPVKNSNLSKISRVETRLRSVLELRLEAEEGTHKVLRELFAQHVFVGSVNPKYSLVQYSTKLYLCNTQKIMQELFYQFILYNFQNFGIIKFSHPLSIKKLALTGLDLPEVGWTPADGDKEHLAQNVAEILTDKGEMLKEYFSVDIDKEGNLNALPLILENHAPDLAGLPTYLIRLASEVNWEVEKECFKTFAIETATYYSELSEEAESGGNSNWKWVTEHVMYPAIKQYFLPPKSFSENASILQIADLPTLYKVFERC
ncbi:DNA mismatch repair protein Mlh1 C-terminus [Popillia japonica]|uniref:DNA mismatch repair protein Mlh1 C-terminus n=1 Tax=Popillia japonica TaxID=7064 RepID=A0AAW1JD60_POPJA